MCGLGFVGLLIFLLYSLIVFILVLWLGWRLTLKAWSWLQRKRASGTS